MNDNKWDYIFKIFLMCTALYFLLHIGFALAQSAPPPPPMQCTSNGMGTIICYPL